MNNHQLTATGTKIAGHLLAVMVGVILVMIGLLLERADGWASPGHPDRSGRSADRSLGAVRESEVDARGLLACVNGGCCR